MNDLGVHLGFGLINKSVTQPSRRPSVRELLASSELRQWKDEYERNKFKSDHNRVAVVLETKLDQMLTMSTEAAVQKRTLDEREESLKAQEEAVRIKKEELVIQQQEAKAWIDSQVKLINDAKNTVQNQYNSLVQQQNEHDWLVKHFAIVQREVEIEKNEIEKRKNELDIKEAELDVRSLELHHHQRGPATAGKSLKQRMAPFVAVSAQLLS